MVDRSDRAGVQRGPENLDKAAIDRVLATADPKMRNSQFMQFLSKVSTGELELRDNQVVPGVPVNHDAAWAELYGDGNEESFQQEQNFSGGQWAEDYARTLDRDNIGGMEHQWVDDYKEQFEDNFDAAEFAEWQKNNPEAQINNFGEDDYSDFQWQNSFKPPSDPVYGFADDNVYMNRSDAAIEAQKLVEGGHLSDAILALEAVVQKNPEDAVIFYFFVLFYIKDAWRLLGQCHAENEEENQAIAALSEAVKLVYLYFII